jgi:hypothetical protein
MRTFTIAMIVAMLTLPAYAQQRGGGANMPNPNVKTEAQKAMEEKQRKADEKAYNESVSRIPDREQKLDPWGKIR